LKELRILLVGGGSGGHVYPLIAVARALNIQAAEKNINLKLMMLGEGKFIKRAAEDEKIPYKIISSGKLRRYFSFKILLDFIKIPVSFIQSFWHVFWFMPDIVFSKGGYDSIAPIITAKIYFIPVFIHESDSVPGLANSILGKIADKLFISFKTADKYFEGKEIIFTGNPVRKELANGSKEEAWKFFDFHEPKPTVLILGGSQGAKAINDVILSSLVVMTQKFNVIHQCGESQFKPVRAGLDAVLREGTRQYSEPVSRYYRLYSFFDENQLAMAYAIADLVVSRAGAGSLFEIAKFGKPAIIVPIAQSPGNHQYLNAFEFSLYGGYLIEEKNLNRETLIREIESILKPENYAKINEKIKTFSTPEAADKIAEEIFKYLSI